MSHLTVPGSFTNRHYESEPELLGSFWTFPEARREARRSLLRGGEDGYEEYRECRRRDEEGDDPFTHESLDDKEDDAKGIRDFHIRTSDGPGGGKPWLDLRIFLHALTIYLHSGK